MPRPSLLTLRAVTKGYRNGEVLTPVLHGVDLEVRHGDYIALMGSSGSGKSTLMNLIGLLDRCDTGPIDLQGRDVGALDSDAQAVIRNGRIGFVFQSFNLLRRLSVLENVALPVMYGGAGRKAALVCAREMLKKVHLSDLADRLPNQLSGGQQQRVAIARALVNRPQLLLADEPTGNLDTRTTSDVLDVFNWLNREEGLTIVLVTHEPDVALRSHRLVRLSDGRIAFDGPPEGSAYK